MIRIHWLLKIPIHSIKMIEIPEQSREWFGDRLGTAFWRAAPTAEAPTR